jgi:hypothetical protein
VVVGPVGRAFLPSNAGRAEMQVGFDTSSAESYRLFLKAKSLPSVRFVGHTAVIPDEYAHLLLPDRPAGLVLPDYEPLAGLWDYQRDISKIAIKKKKFALFMDCGSGKSNIMLEYSRYVNDMISPNRRVLIVTPLMVVPQFVSEVQKFYGESHPGFVVEQVRAALLPEWVKQPGSSIGITNYEALTDRVPQGRLGALILDESSMLKSTYGKHAEQCMRLGSGLEWKLCGTGTPAPNDRIEYGNHAVFLDEYPTFNAFLARFFVNRGKTGERWELKPHAVDAFYRALSHWSIFVTNPAIYGWEDNTRPLPPIHIHVHDVDLTDDQKAAVRDKMGTLFACDVGGVVRRSKLSQIAKGNHDGRKISTFKPGYIRQLVDSWPDESTIIWCLYNREQQALEEVFPNAVSITGTTPYRRRLEGIHDFKSGKRNVMLTKGKILGFGLNLQVCTRQVFSGLVDSYELMYQCIKRSNRYGSSRDLNVHIPITDVEAPMVENALRKARRIQEDTEIQEGVFRKNSCYGVMK